MNFDMSLIWFSGWWWLQSYYLHWFFNILTFNNMHILPAKLAKLRMSVAFCHRDVSLFGTCFRISCSKRRTPLLRANPQSLLLFKILQIFILSIKTNITNIAVSIHDIVCVHVFNNSSGSQRCTMFRSLTEKFTFRRASLRY